MQKAAKCQGLRHRSLKIIEDADETAHIRIAARPSRWHENDCPICHRRCPRYDSKCKTPRVWRGMDWEGHICERRVHPFHVVEWAMEALDEVRREVWKEAHD